MYDDTPEVPELVHMLRHLRAAQGNPTLAAISRRTNGEVSVATLSRLFSGKVLPSRAAVHATTTALTRDSASMAAISRAYDRARRDRYRHWLQPPRERTSTLPARRRATTSPEEPALRQLQGDLDELRRAAGLSIRELGELTGIPRGTISDVLHHSRLPRPENVAVLAQACGGNADEWHEAALRLLQAREQQLKAAKEAQERSPADALIETAVTRPPAEIAALATNLKNHGEPGLAARLIETAVSKLAVDDITALALALLKHTPTDTPPGVPAQKNQPQEAHQ